MNDHEKIARVLSHIERPGIYPLPSYTYLAHFLADVAASFKEETELRKSLAKANLALMVLLMVMVVVAAIGWLR